VLRVVALVLTVLLGWPAAAEEAPATAAVSVGDLEALVKTIEDPQQRDKLVVQLKALIAAGRAGEPEETRLSAELVTVGEKTIAATSKAVTALSESLADWDDIGAWLARLAATETSRDRAFGMLRNLALLLGAGWLWEGLAWWRLGGVRRRLTRPTEGAVLDRFGRVVAASAVHLAPIVAFALGAHVAFLVVQPNRQLGAAALTFAVAYSVVRALRVAARLVLAPHQPHLRFLPVGDATAALLLRWFNRFSGVAVFGYFVIETCRLLGLPQRGADGLMRVLVLAILIMAIVFVLRLRRPVHAWASAAAEDSGDGAPVLRWVAAVWPIFAIVCMIGAFVAWALRLEGDLTFLMRAIVLTVVVGVAAVLVLRGLLRLIGARFGAAAASTQGARGRRGQRYLPGLGVAARVGVTLAAVLLLVEVWGFQAFSWFRTQAGERVIGAAATIGLVLVVAVAVWEAANAAVEAYLQRKTGDGVVARSARARTILPLLKNVLLGFLGLIVVLIVLSELGVNVGPLIAGAGVIGVAVGFGSQKLVQDVINGFFILVEDAVAVGDVVEVAGVGGLVEAISVRTLRLRDLSGNVHTIPFSAVGTVTNMTKDFSYYLTDIGVGYGEDPDRVTGVLKAIDETLRADPEFAPAILAPIEVFGVDSFAESAVIIKARLKTKPLEQWRVGREFNRRLKRRFDELGIRIPFPHRTVVIEKEGEISPPAPPTAIVAAPQTPPAPTQPRPA
jgi:small conductance mechanosensitive channel